MKVKQLREQLREMSPEELQLKLNDYKEELFNLRFQLATGQLKNVMSVKEVRKNIARIKTIMRERALNIGK